MLRFGKLLITVTHGLFTIGVQIVLSCEYEHFDIADYSDVNEDNTQEQYETVFRYLDTLSSEYRIFLWTTILANCKSEAVQKNILSPKPQLNGDCMWHA